jgi:hypothetical protein
MNSPTYSGTLIKQLFSTVERNAGLDMAPQTHIPTDPAAASLAEFERQIAQSDPAMYLADVKRHFGDPGNIRDKNPRDSHDSDAYILLGRVQECLFSGLTEVCARCGQLEGLHAHAGNFCPTDTPKFWFSEEDTFLRMESQSERMIRTGLDKWLDWRAGCD